MELKIYNPTKDGFLKAIEWNHEDIKKEVSEKVEHYKNLVYTDEQIKDAKADRAALRKFAEALEDKRKEIKKQCLAPYESFEKQMKEIIAIVNEPVALIDKQVKEYEEKQKKDKLESIKEYWKTQQTKTVISKPEGLTFEKVFDPKWLNANTSMKSIKAAINDAIDKFNAEMDTLANLPEFSFEAQQTYISTLDIKKALNEAHRLSEMAKMKAEQEKLEKEKEEQEKLRAEQEKLRAEQAKAEKLEDNFIPFAEEVQVDNSESCENFIPTFPKEPEKEWAVVKVKMNDEDKAALEQYFKDNNLEFKFL